MADDFLRYQSYFHSSEQRISDNHEQIIQCYRAIVAQFASDLPSVPHFTGRQAEQQLISAELEQARLAHGVVPVVLISGAAKVGKSALAVHVAHQLQLHFPGFQIYGDLRQLKRQPGRLKDAITALLPISFIDSALPDQVSPAPSTQVDQFQSLFRERGILLLDNLPDDVLDDAEDIVQLQSLLSLNSFSLIIVTSSCSLTHLIPAEKQLSLELTALPEQDTVALFKAISEPTVSTQPKLVRSTVELCQHSPLAIVLLGTWLRRQPQLSLQECLQQLTNACRLQSSDFNVEQACFSLLYQHLAPTAARLLRLSALRSEPTFSNELAAILLNSNWQAGQLAINQLLQVGLIEQIGNQYRFIHPSIRLLALKQLAYEESLDQRQLVRFRLSRFYEATAKWMCLNASPVTRSQIASVLNTAQLNVSAEQLQILTAKWLIKEKPHLLTAIDWMYQAERWDWLLRLTSHLVGLLQVQRHWHQAEIEQLQRYALEASQRLKQPAQIACLLNNLGNLATQQQNWQQAQQYYQQSLNLLQQLQDSASEARTLMNLGICYALQNQLAAAVVQWQQASEQLPLSAPEQKHLRRWIQSHSSEQALESPSLFQTLGTAIKKFWLN